MAEDLNCKEEVFKLVIVGDGGVGKTSMLMSFVQNQFPENYIPTVLETYAKIVIVDGAKTTLQLWDTAGQESYDRLRNIAYPNTSVFMLVFNIASPNSLDNIEDKWYPELCHYCPDTPMILVGNQLDRREEAKNASKDKKCTSFSDGMVLAKNLGISNYVECSALNRKGLTEAFEESTRICRNKNKRKSSIKNNLSDGECCTLM